MTNGDEVDPLDAFMSTLETEMHQGAATVPDNKGKEMVTTGSHSRYSMQQQQPVPLPLLEDEEDAETDDEVEDQSKEAVTTEAAFDPEKLKNLSAEEVIA